MVGKDFQARNGKLAEIRWQLQFEPLRDDPRFKDLLKRMGFAAVASVSSRQPKRVRDKNETLPPCNRVETDEALAFCRTDGAALVVESSRL